MDCLKCGSPTQGEQVFCPDCLKSAARAPVKSDVRVVIPRRDPPPVRTVQTRAKKPEEIIERLRRQVWRLSTAVVCISIALAMALGALTFIVYRELNAPLIGENYNTVASE